jgi:hypothetical protein
MSGFKTGSLSQLFRGRCKSDSSLKEITLEDGEHPELGAKQRRQKGRRREKKSPA